MDIEIFHLSNDASNYQDQHAGSERQPIPGKRNKGVLLNIAQQPDNGKPCSYGCHSKSHQRRGGEKFISITTLTVSLSWSAPAANIVGIPTKKTKRTAAGRSYEHAEGVP